MIRRCDKLPPSGVRKFRIAVTIAEQKTTGIHAVLYFLLCFLLETLSDEL